MDDSKNFIISIILGLIILMLAVYSFLLNTNLNKNKKQLALSAVEIEKHTDQIKVLNNVVEKMYNEMQRDKNIESIGRKAENNRRKIERIIEEVDAILKK